MALELPNGELPRGERGGPPGVQPLPRLLERAASKAPPMSPPLWHPPGSELLLLVPSLAGIVGSVVLPILGAVPDGAIMLFSGLGPGAQEQMQVGVGALAGTRSMRTQCHLGAPPPATTRPLPPTSCPPGPWGGHGWLRLAQAG